MTIFTIGHSTLAQDEFLQLLRTHGIAQLVDVRRYPGSRRHPQFSAESLAHALRNAGVEYTHEPDLGGRRTPRKDSPNTAWRSASFRAYADHMGSGEFRAALERLLVRAALAPTAIMCAEAVPWRCHRQLIADALVARGHDVRNIVGSGPATPHRLNPSARLAADGTLSYPAGPADQPSLL